MTEQELIQSGRLGLYRADLDSFFFVGEEPEAVEPILTPVPATAIATPKPVANPTSLIGVN